tara:strand:+ start:359 stop:544 length:186 start_codon:yes stop_codon:yes gene_type:complete
MKNIKGRNDIFRDDSTGALIYEKTTESKIKSDVKRMKKEIHTLRDQLDQIQVLLERALNGR